MFSFHIPNMTCGGCAKTVTRILHGVDPQARVETDPLGARPGSRALWTSTHSSRR